MSRNFVFGNGTILVCLDEHAQLRDFYFPYVGQENHVNGKIHKLGVWVDSSFSWFESKDWKKELKYKKDTAIGEVNAVNENLNIELKINDTVHHKKNIYLRKILVKNNENREREVRIFCHQLFQLSEAGVGNTVYYNPFLSSLVYYKGQRYFLVRGCYSNETKHGISNYTADYCTQDCEGGAVLDIEDGILKNKTIAHGSVDSAVSFEFTIPPHGEEEIYYWICAGKKLGEVSRLNTFVIKKTPKHLMEVTKEYWLFWVHKTKFEFKGLSDKIVNLFKRSLLTIQTHVDKRGAFIASCDSDMLYLKRDTYAYMWPRDGALIARSLDRAGYANITEKFFKFCCKALTSEGYLFHKYRADGSLGSSWHSWLKEGKVQLPIQEDQLALVLDALWKHFVEHKNKEYIENIFDCSIRALSDFMFSFVDEETGLPKESYDLWEEKLGVHTFTCATVYAGFRAAANFEEVFGDINRKKKFEQAAEKVKNAILKYLYDPEKKIFLKGIYYKEGKLHKDETFDASSVYGIYQFGVLPLTDERVRSNFALFEERLKCDTPVGGHARYEGDVYYKVRENVPGNPWFIISLWLAEYYIACANTKKELERAIEIFEWVEKLTMDTGILSEQLNPDTGEPLSVAPLTWSHAGFVIAIDKYLEKFDLLDKKEKDAHI
jgi:oligosaccharide amylase